MRKRVLIVEDDAGWRHILTRILERDCLVVGYAERGDAVAATAERLHPDVVTLDVSLRGKSGLNVLLELRELLPEAILVIVTAHANPHYRDEAFRRGADAYVAKNRVFEELLAELAPPPRDTIGRLA
jgi:DNA-binding response OmpR family regulator